jgi:hypothetical protein
MRIDYIYLSVNRLPMKPFWFSIALFGVCHTLPTYAQTYRIKPFVNPTDVEWDKRKETYVYSEKLSYWWWFCTYQQVRDKMVAEPGWDVYALDENFDNQNALFVTNRRLNISMVFYFTKVKVGTPEKLFKRRFLYPLSDPMIEEWTERLSKLPYDEEKKEWTDIEHFARIIRGTNESSQVVYELYAYHP